MDWRAGHLTTTEGTGGEAFANYKNCPQGWAFKIFFKCPGYAQGFARGGGMLAAGNDSHTSGALSCFSTSSMLS